LEMTEPFLAISHLKIVLAPRTTKHLTNFEL